MNPVLSGTISNNEGCDGLKKFHYLERRNQLLERSLCNWSVENVIFENCVASPLAPDPKDKHQESVVQFGQAAGGLNPTLKGYWEYIYLSYPNQPRPKIGIEISHEPDKLLAPYGVGT